MSMRRHGLMIAAVGTLAVLATGCMKPEAETARKPGMYSGKPDTRPFEAGRTEFTYGNWSAGDKASWETNLRARNQSQNEYAKQSSAK